ncbi:hypothetical protein BLL42_22915 [Pseudomonas frederiksbergensis]|uniref:Uncharacterized protein n=1 Tax=Pseudomonas frederiksbergensis TaxID=104087 RepID=A0A1J0EQZ2_9PSED|nr:hypothetical protein BLL42_22915 [Pseudomonas frederiksbergensis]
MIIEITEQLARHRWIVHMDGWEAGFGSRDEAEAFVRQLKARINAPHAWPANAVTELLIRQPPGSRSDPVVEQRAQADLAR